MVIGLLTAAALIAAGLFAVLTDDNKSALPAAITSGPTTLTLPAAIATLAAVSDFDPDDPDLEGENPDLVGLAFDGNASTGWKTNCYESKFFGGKVGVGLVAELSTRVAWQPQFDHAKCALPGGRLCISGGRCSDVNGRVGRANSKQEFLARTRQLSLPSISAEPAHFVLFLLHEAGADSGCNAKRPYRAQVTEISFTPTP